MARLLIEDVTITRNDDIALGIRLRGGATRELRLAPELPAWQRYRTPDRVVARIDRLLERHTDAEIAALLNEGSCSPDAEPPSTRGACRRSAASTVCGPATSGCAPAGC